MARPLRLEFEGALYHVTSRGNAREKIFLDESDYQTFLEVLAKVVKRYNWLLYAYSLMPNHYHLLLETPDGNLSRGMRQLNGIYTQAFNRRHRRVGHLFQGRYKAILVEKDSHLLEVARYIVLNPVRAHLAESPKDWPWTSYKDTAGFSPTSSLLSSDWLVSQFGQEKRKAAHRYRRFIQEGLKSEAPWSKVRGSLFLGPKSFVESFALLLSDKQELKEIPRSQRYVARPSLDKLFIDKETRLSPTKAKTIYEAHTKYGYTLKEIARFLGVHYSTVSRAIKRTMEGEM